MTGPRAALAAVVDIRAYSPMPGATSWDTLTNSCGNRSRTARASMVS